MDVVVPVQELQFESATTTPYMSAPSSPKHFGLDPLELYYPYAGLPASPTDDDFAFDFSGQLDSNAQPPPLTSADELFEQGKIRPLRPPPRLCGSPHDPFTATIKRGRNGTPVSVSPTISPSRSLKGSRSLSPLKTGKGRTHHIQTPISSQNPPTATISCSCTRGGGEGSWKWRIKDFLLFRSASEGRATGDRSKDFLQKFTALPSSSSFQPNLKKEGGRDVSRSSSFRSVDSNGSVRQGSARRDVSPHARHYTANKAAAEEMKKKTALPYRQSFFSCLRFSPALHNLTSRGW
ncbi:uncharacterized protein LOC110027851 [Phalaenopsis equestris]|uniref:uncharacterized protein LOC110027851 n=1 Tax=Phalaenopsis equestris TaxID=78828 RepID=UPI0009E25810|nr:uncharacterized protein LOC110027851 [Phalaenopsis equestris]